MNRTRNESMLYEIDESCLTVIKTKDKNSIAFLEQLALDRRKSKNMVVAKREVFFALADFPELSMVSRGIYWTLGNRMSERKLLLDRTKKYCRLIASKPEGNLIQEGDSEIILLNISEVSEKDFTDYSIMLAENEDDIAFYQYVGQYYVRQNEIGNIRIHFEGQNGGGSTTANVLERIASEKKRMCLCITDSDRKYGNDMPGETMGRIIEVTKRIQPEFYEVILLEVHEIENLIPISVLEKIVSQYRLDSQGIEFIKYLVENDSTRTSPVFYYDFKKGILKDDFILKQNASKDEIKKFNKKELHRVYWKKYVEGFRGEIREESEQNLVSGICEKVLKYTLQYFQENVTGDRQLSFDPEEHLQDLWNEIGQKVYCWGCVGGRIAG